MKQILQSLKDGTTELAEVPAPRAAAGQVLIATTRSVVSAGTERMLVDFGKASYLDKARQQPDKVKQVLDKVKTDGLAPTLDAVRNKLDQPLPLGYCNAGVVLESGVEGFAPGDRVVSNGHHAEVVRVPKHLCARIPDGVDDESAAFTVLGAIGLQGIRLVNPTLGEAVVVSGLGLIGLLTVQMLRANGCRVLGVDFDTRRCALARQFGAEAVDLSLGEDPVAAALAFSRGRGVDAVIVTASTRSDELMHQAADMCRKRGRIVLVGVVGLNLRRDDFFKKELTFQVSASYGPGRYDPLYEEQGQDYPVGFVRWTEQRNFEAVLDMLAAGTLDVKPLITHRLALAEAERAYAIVGGAEPSLGIVLEYPGVELGELSRTVALAADAAGSVVGAQPCFDAAQHRPGRAALDAGEIGPIGLTSPRGLGSYEEGGLSPRPMPNGAEAGQGSHGVGRCVVSFIGSGNYATAVLIPAFKATGAVLQCVASSGGVSGVHAGRKFGFAETTTDTDRVFDDAAANTVVISTRHDSHARLVIRALRAGKHVFVEKPLCLTLAELAEIEGVLLGSPSPQPSPLEGEGEQGIGGSPDAPGHISEVAAVGAQPSGRTAPVNFENPEAGVLAGGTNSGGEGASSPRPVLSGVEAGLGSCNGEAGLLMVGFNRRFSPLVVKMKALLSGLSAPKAMVMTVNAGAIPADHWTQDPAVGGGRIIGEACHFIDLLRHIAGAPIVSHSRLAMESATGDSVSLQLGFADGSIGTIHYLANGHKSFPKERLEVFCGGRILQLDNLRQLTGFGWPGFSKMKLWRQDKGQKACAAAFVSAVEQGGSVPIPLTEILEVSRVTIEVAGR